MIRDLLINFFIDIRILFLGIRDRYNLEYYYKYSNYFDGDILKDWKYEHSYLDISGYPNNTHSSYFTENLVLDTNGCLSSKETFSYGVYKFNIRLPYHADNIISEITFTNTETYPPEIVLLKSYHRDHDCISIENDILIGNNLVNKKSLGYKNYINKFQDNTISSCVLHWEKKFIKMYINNNLVRVIYNKNILEEFNFNPKMYINFRCYHINSDKNNVQLLSYPFKIYSFLYTKIDS